MMTTQENFEVKLPLFEGPFDLLLFFIERDELDIYDIPIAKIASDFLDYIRLMEAAEHGRGQRVHSGGGNADAHQVKDAAAPATA